MSTNKFAISSHLSGSLILSTVMFFSFGAGGPVFAQTSDTRNTATESSEPSPQSNTKDASKVKHAAGSFSVDQVPDGAVLSNDQLIKL